jgi:UDP-N-acetylglucosamine--dolichyl-phosphate N-acetylglucosaminephosphotransferase
VSLQALLALSLLAFCATLRLVPLVAAKTLSRGLFGLDINKRGTAAGEVKVPEAVGLAPGTAFLGCGVLFQLLMLLLVGTPADACAHAALGCCATALLLGFVDDVLDIPLREQASSYPSSFRNSCPRVPALH